MQGRSNYHNSLDEEFTFTIIDEIIDDEFKEFCYRCKLLKKYQKKYAMKDRIFTLRKNLFHNTGIYIIVPAGEEEPDEEVYEQLNLFDFMED